MTQSRESKWNFNSERCVEDGLLSRIKRNRKIHFRNVSGPIPRFVETFVDNGYTDMLKLMRTLYEVDFRGAVIADHVPTMVGSPRTGWAYSIGYIKALLAAVSAEKG